MNWDYFPSNRLCLEITDPTCFRWNEQNLIGRWYDRKTTKVENYLSDAMIALATGAASVKHRRAKEAERRRLEAEEAERRRREEARCERAKKRREFLFKKADEYAQFSKLATLAHVLRPNLNVDGTAPVDRMGRVLDILVMELGQQFERDILNAEIAHHGLFADDDPV